MEVRTFMQNGIIKIHGKDYMTVARRVELAHESKALDSVKTEVLSFNPVVVRAEVAMKGGKTYTGISAVLRENARLIEKENPFEVAETSAVGRALGFAGFGIIESVASADEMVRAKRIFSEPSNQPKLIADGESSEEVKCAVCGDKAEMRTGSTKMGKPYKALVCSTGDRSHTRWFYGNYAN